MGFSFLQFNSSDGQYLSANGVAAIDEDLSVLSLANGTSNAGSVYYATEMDLVDGFSTSFSVSLFSYTDGTGDDAPEGFTFLLSGSSLQAMGDEGSLPPPLFLSLVPSVSFALFSLFLAVFSLTHTVFSLASLSRSPSLAPPHTHSLFRSHTPSLWLPGSSPHLSLSSFLSLPSLSPPPSRADLRGAAGLGYASKHWNGTDGIHNSLAVEFDFHTDAQMEDPAYAHVSVHSVFNSSLANSALESYSVGVAALPYAASGLAQTHVVDVAYDAPDVSLTISVDGETLLVVTDLSIAAAIGGSSGLVGFSASNGPSNAASYWLNSWAFSSVGPSNNPNTSAASASVDSSYPGVTNSSAVASSGSAVASSGYSSGGGDDTTEGITPLGIFAICGGLFLCVALCCLVVITIFISSEE